MVVTLLLLGCAGPPNAPESNDPAYSIDHRVWSIIGNTLTDGHDTIDATIDGGGTTVWVDDTPFDIVDGQVSFDVADLAPGEHTLIWQDGGRAVAATELIRSHPYYVLNSVDWDNADTADRVLDWQQQLHDEHVNLVITHFVGPYTWTDPALTSERQDVLTNELKGYRDDHGDEIALHIHPYCNFVNTTSVTCLDAPSFVYETDASGYTVANYAYSEDDFATLVAAADDIFEAQGFAKPTSYRAGGWSADPGVLRALYSQGYVADTSANNWSLMEEWIGQGTLYTWNEENWSAINETSQPYYPQNTDIQRGGDDPIGILEVPDNGILVDYVTAEEMIEVFEANWDGDALDVPTQLSIGWHNSASAQFRARMGDALDEIDEHQASNDEGPVIYETLSNMVLVWPQ